jgi:hypothetical protein
VIELRAALLPGRTMSRKGALLYAGIDRHPAAHLVRFGTSRFVIVASNGVASRFCRAAG